MGIGSEVREIKRELTLRGNTLLDCSTQFHRGKQSANALSPRQKNDGRGFEQNVEEPNHIYGSVYLRGRMEREAGLKRRFVLAVSNVVAAIGLVGLLSYAFIGQSGKGPEVTAATGPTLRVRIAEKAPALVLEEVVHVPAVLSEQPNILRAAIDDTFAQLNVVGAEPAPASTGTVSASFEMRRLVIGPDSGRDRAPRHQLVRQASLSPGLGISRQQILTDGNDVGPPKAASAPDSQFQQEGLALRPSTSVLRPGSHDQNSSVHVSRAQDGNASIQLAFTPPAFIIRDVNPDDRTDLIEADEVSRKLKEEKSATKDRRLQRQRYCMAHAVYYEARGESHQGQLAVAQVVTNRVASKRYPNTICGVVFQGKDRRNRCQFSFACDGRPERPRPGKSWNQALKIAKNFEAGGRYSKVAEATHYHADYVRPRWARSMRRISKIGRHIFLNGV